MTTFKVPVAFLCLEQINVGFTVVKIIDRMLLIASLDNTNKSNLKHSKLSEAQHVMRNLFVL